MNHSVIVSFLWGVADLIRDTFKRGKYQDVILPLTVLRRLDCVLAGTKEKVLGKQAELRGKKLENLDPQLRKIASFAFYNTSRYDFEKLLADAPHLAANLRNYIAGFSPNMREVLEKFDFDNTISKLDEAGLLFQVLERFKNIDLHPNKIDNPTMGTIFEELIRKFNEALNENPGEHFTPRDVVHLMVDLMLAGDERGIRAKKAIRTAAGRFAPGLPRISDGQLLFLLHMLARAKDPKEGGSRIAIIMNGSPLFTGDAKSGESEIRRFILESDLLEALIALPEQLFYNTGIATYVWVVTNRKARARKGKVQLIDATSFWVPMRKNLGDKRREIPLERSQDILKILADFRDGDTRAVAKDGKTEDIVVSRIFPTTHFGFRKITVERPLRLNLQATPERIARLEQEKSFQALARSKKKGAAGAKQHVEGRALQEEIRKLLRALPNTILKDRAEFERALDTATKRAGVKLPASAREAVLSALSERDEAAAICYDKDGNPAPDPEPRDTESVPLAETVEAFFDREVKPHVPDAWIDTSKRDPKDGQIGFVGYEINFNRYFYRYTPPRPLEEIEADIRGIEKDIVRMLAEVTGGAERQ